MSYQALKTAESRWLVNMTAKLGEGGFGVVYRGRDRGDKTENIPERECAAKKVHFKDKEDKEIFLAELDILVKVQTHPCVIGIFGKELIDNDGWVFMEMATGGELFDRLIDSGSLSERDAWPYAKGIAEAIAHCHAQGVVHRDLKLENVMLSGTDPNAVKVVDFGLAIVVPLQSDGSMVEDLIDDSAGTQAYKPPEVCAKGAYSPLKIDTWAAGIVVFSLVSGFFPLQEAKTDDWRYKRLLKDQSAGVGACDSIYKTYKRECPFSPQVKGLLDAMLAIDVAKRLTMAGVRAHPWFDCEPKPPPARKPVYRGVNEGDDPMDDDEDDLHQKPPDDAVEISRQRATAGRR